MIGFTFILALFLSTVYCTNVFGPFCSESNLIENIPNTSLKTGVFYTVTTQNTTNSFMTWSIKSHPLMGHRYIVTDQSVKHRYKYEKGGTRYYHAQWYFIPAKGHPGWYHLVNRGVPGEFAAWGYKGGEKLGDHKYYLILDPTYANSVENDPKPEYLFKPVKQGTSYQLKLKALPDAFVAGCNAEEAKGSDRFYLLANCKDDEALDYKNNGRYYASSLFNFEPI